MTDNPKTAAGAKKPPVLSVMPTTMLLELGGVMALGARKYGAYNWRESDVPASIYVDAACRHLLSWWDGEDVDPESGLSHLAHLIACAAILVDAKRHNRLKDDRPPKGASGSMISNFQERGVFDDPV